MSTWTNAKDQMPPRSAQNPDHSDYVLTCPCPNGVASADAYGLVQDHYDGTLMSAYYDFVKERWTNDGLTAGDTIRVSHWMPLPAEHDPAWTAADEAIPGEETSDVDLEGCSISVLTSVADVDYEASLVSAMVVFQDGRWLSYTQALLEDIKVARWRPQPDSDGI
jgi:hypothetical protein